MRATWVWTLALVLAAAQASTAAASPGSALGHDGQSARGRTVEPLPKAARQAADQGFEAVFDELRRGDFRTAMAALEALFPADYESLREDMRLGYLSGPRSELVLTRTALGRLMAREMPAITSAPDDYLINYLIANRNGYEVAARTRPELCNQIAAGVIDISGEVEPETARAFSDVTAALLHAAAASRVRSVERSLAPMTDSEFELLVTELIALGITSSQAAMIDSPAAMAAAPPLETCRVRALLLDATLRLPPPIAARFAAGMISTSVARRPH